MPAETGPVLPLELELLLDDELVVLLDEDVDELDVDELDVDELDVELLDELDEDDELVVPLEEPPAPPAEEVETVVDVELFVAPPPPVDVSVEAVPPAPPP
jgi:hypothetical protein